VVNQGAAPSTGASNAGGSIGYYASSSGGQQQRTGVQKSDAEAVTPAGSPASVSASPAAPQITQVMSVPAQPTVQPSPPAVSPTSASDISKLVLVSWLRESGKDEIFVQNTETKELQKITSKPNRNNLRIVEVHPSEDLNNFEAIISNGSEQGPVRFRF
jgi:hypothetical protein